MVRHEEIGCHKTSRVIVSQDLSSVPKLKKAQDLSLVKMQSSANAIEISDIQEGRN